MRYYFSKPTTYSSDEAVTRVTDELKKEGFDVLTGVAEQVR
jgi:uncharacterized protein (DUF302 family)